MTVLDEIYDTRGISADLAQRDRLRIWRPTPRIPVVVDRAEGVYLYDTDARRVLDFTSGWNVANTGWNHPQIISAVSRQLTHTAFAPPWCATPGRVAFAEQLCATLDGDYHVMSLTSGSEAVETALKIARRATGRRVIVGFQQAYHGGTLGAMLAGGVPSLQGRDLTPTADHRHVPIMSSITDPARYRKEVCAAIVADPLPAAILFEPFFSNPGVLYLDREFYQAVAATAKSVGALLILDEVGTGFGRTGKMFGFEHWGLKPDLVAVAKAITSGVVPMASTLVRSELIASVTGPGFASTFGWTPLACAAAQASLEILRSENLCDRARERGETAKARLGRHLTRPGVHDIRGEGLELGIEFRTPDGQPFAPEVMRILTAALLRRGLFAEPSAFTSTLLLMPPLIISENELAQALDILVEEIVPWLSTYGH